MSGSTFGHLFRVTNFGESHGPAIGCVIDGCPPGLALSADGQALYVSVKQASSPKKEATAPDSVMRIALK